MIHTELQIYENVQFGSVRTAIVSGEVMFVAKDVTDILGYQNGSRDINRHVDDEDKLIEQIVMSGQNRDVILINESGLYSLILSSKMPKAKEFKRWVTAEVLPSIRKKGFYSQMTTGEQIQLLAKGNVELSARIGMVEDKVHALEEDMPLYGCEIDEVQKHVKRKVVEILGGKGSKAYHDNSIRSSVFSDIYTQIKREYGLVSSYKSIKRKYIADVHGFIDCYNLPRIIEENVLNANAQRSF